MADSSTVAYDVTTPPAGYARAEADRRRRLIIAGLVVYFAVLIPWLWMALTGRLPSWTLLALLGVLGVRPSVDAYVDRQVNWERGARAERAVGEVLNELRYAGWIIMHDVAQEFEGNIDHIVSGPGGVFMIETKLRRYDESHLTKARRQAAKLHDALGVWVTPVIALHLRKDAKCFKHKGVWIVPRQSLRGWLEEQHNAPLPFERLARFADQL